MDSLIDRPHRSNSINNSTNITTTTTTTSELFICFTSRLSSSSSMKLSSKSILSPGRPREPSQISLSASLSRRLRSNGSMKGGQASPMFPKKRGCAYENPEPSSPKVTCIGQVRVKTKKQGKKLRARSGSVRRSGDVSFRRLPSSNNTFQDCIQNQNPSQDCLPHRNQRWVHLPLTICEALRAFGAEFKCFLPCKSQCLEKEDKHPTADRDGSGSSCGAVFARWLVAVQDGDCKERDIELVVGEVEETEQNEEDDNEGSYRRRHVFEEIDFKEERLINGENKEEGGRVSICIPPKNALLLMRCRSDPDKLATLANKFWEPQPFPIEDDEDETIAEHRHTNFWEPPHPVVSLDNHEEENEVVDQQKFENQETEKNETLDRIEHQSVVEEEGEVKVVFMDDNNISCRHKQEQEEELEVVEEIIDNVELEQDPKQEIVLFTSDKLVEAVEQHEFEDSFAKEEIEALEQCEFEDPLNKDDNEAESKTETEAVLAEEITTKEQCEEEEGEEAVMATIHERSEHEDSLTGEESEKAVDESRETEKRQTVLPDCLLLMMCEPKLSMEVSKETWVCSTDFIRWLPEKSTKPLVKQTSGGDETKKKRISIEVNNAVPVQGVKLQQPPRSSCSYPAKPPSHGAGAGAELNGSVGDKKVNKGGYEPFMLKRCKSEPMRTAAKLAPEACCWKNRKLEPHRPAAVGVGAAGVGF